MTVHITLVRNGVTYVVATKRGLHATMKLSLRPRYRLAHGRYRLTIRISGEGRRARTWVQTVTL